MSNICTTSIDSGITYSGYVSVKILRNGVSIPVQIKNRGTVHLFKLISDVLADVDGSLSYTNRIPYRFDFLSLENDNYVSCTKEHIKITSTVNASDNECSIVFTGLLTNGDKAIDSLNAPKLVIKNKNDTDNILAEIIDDTLNEVWTYVTINSEAIIEWTMVFANKIIS